MAIPILNWFLFILLLRNGSSISAPDVEGFEGLQPCDYRLESVPCESLLRMVPCYMLSGHVTYLSLGSIGFSGALSPSICKLKLLNSLELQDNNLSGELPACLSSLVNLKNLDLSHNKFIGSIPSSWEHLPITTRKSKVEIVLLAAGCGAFFLLLLGAAFTYRWHQLHKFKNEVFVDVAGEDEGKFSFGQIKKLLKENRLHDIVDSNMKTYDPKEVEMIVQVALLCTQNAPEDRPRMAEVVKMLKGVGGLIEKWAEWETLEEARNQEMQLSLMTHRFAWMDESMDEQEAMQLSSAR
ncbi:hypothetical protein RDABS01_030114 [Bienertia sinuspersici]